MYIPNKLFFRIGEVAELAGVETYVLRYWETEFKDLCPKKNEKGQRLYQKKEVEVALNIKDLLYEQGYTIEGARKALKKRSRKNNKGPTQLSIPFDREKLVGVVKDIREDLREILKLLY